MHKPTNYYSPQIVIQLSRLLEQVQEEIATFEAPVMNCADKNLNETARSLIRECRQHASELVAYILCLGGKPSPAALHIKVDTGSRSQSFMSNEEMLQCLGTTEKRLLAAYRTALNEPLFTHDVRAVLRRQFNSLVYLFLQAKAFDATR